LIKLEIEGDPYADINWTKRLASIKSKEGDVIYEKSVTFPDYFSDTAVNITASKYFHKSITHEENNLKDLIDRVSDTIDRWCPEDDLSYKLKHYQIHQVFAFNSPVYFNLGLTESPQASACFILSIDDDMKSITDTMCVESKIFKKGSGSGMNLSKIRSKHEFINGQTGQASGPVSFLKVHDNLAQIIRSGGALRRSAKLACLNMDHPDIEEFIDCKKFEEEKLTVLRNAGIKPRPGCELSDEVYFQSTNLSVRPSNKFMEQVLNGGDWSTRYVTTGEIHKTYKAKDLLMRVAQRTWEMGDPAIQFDDTVNDWNTVLNDGRISSSNPCSEFLFLDNSSCNLASINLIKFFDKTSNGYNFNFNMFKDVVETVITAQDTIIDFASYPTELIMKNSIDYRPLGLGFTNLGSLLMLLGLPYDSNEGRLLSSYLTALLTGIAYQTSNKLAKQKGAFNRFDKNKNSFYKVLRKHHDCLDDLIQTNSNAFDNSVIDDLMYNCIDVWKNIGILVNSGESFRNSQVTLMAPCGTIGYLMDSQTTGIEPEYSHVKYKRLSNTDSGVIKLTSDMTKKCLENLGYNDREVKEIECYITDDKPLALCKCLKYEHNDILNTSTNTYKDQTIHYSGHIKMLGAVQPFISGGISKTASFSNEATVEDIYNCYIESWKLGLKGVAIYRDGSKSYQPLTIAKAPEHKTEDYEIDLEDEDSVLNNLYHDDRLIKYMHSILAKKKLPNDRAAINHRFTVDQIKGYLNLGMFENGELGEVFIKMSKEGSTLSGLLDCLGTLTSISLQRGVPLKDIVEKMCYQQFNPSGFTSNPQIRTATSIVDYIFKYIGMKFLKKEDQLELGLIKEEEPDINFENSNPTKQIVYNKKQSIGNGKICDRCSHIMILKGTCYTCVNCFSSTGSCG